MGDGACHCQSGSLLSWIAGEAGVAIGARAIADPVAVIP